MQMLCMNMWVSVLRVLSGMYQHSEAVQLRVSSLTCVCVGTAGNTVPYSAKTYRIFPVLLVHRHGGMQENHVQLESYASELEMCISWLPLHPVVTGACR